MKHFARKVISKEEKANPELLGEKDKVNPNYKEIEDPKKAKQAIREYLEGLIEKVNDKKEGLKLKAVIAKAREVLSDPKFMEQKRIRSLVDEADRLGYKSKKDSFFGYKAECAIIPHDKIITSVEAGNGEYVDGTKYEEHFKKTKKTGLVPKAGHGDKAYFRKPILGLLEKETMNLYIPPNESVIRIDESKFTYNNDSDQLICRNGCYSIGKKSWKRLH